MSTRDLLRPKPAGPIPTAFEVIRNAGRPDWQTAVPSAPEERRWYTVGYAMKDDYEINQPVSPTLPAAFRLWWALGLIDAKAESPPRALWRKDEPPQSPAEGWGPLAVGGAVAGAVGLGLLLAAARRGDR